MSPVDLNDYVLVKDKDGQLKYYKDGKFYTIEEVEASQKGDQDKVVSQTAKREIKPVQTFEEKMKQQQTKSESVVAPKVPIKKHVQPEPAKIPEKSVQPERKNEPSVKSVNVAPSTNKPSLSTIKSELKSDLPKPQTSQDDLVRGKQFEYKDEIKLENLPHHEEMAARREQDQQVVTEKVNHVIDRLKIQFSDDSIRQRFRSLLTTYFRGVRSKKELSYILTVPKISGGLELPQDKVKVIMAVVGQMDEYNDKDRKKVVTAPRKVVTAKSLENKTETEKPIAVLDHRIAPPPPAYASTKLRQVDLQSQKKDTQPAGPQTQPKSRPAPGPKTVLDQMINKMKNIAGESKVKPEVKQAEEEFAEMEASIYQERGQNSRSTKLNPAKSPNKEDVTGKEKLDQLIASETPSMVTPSKPQTSPSVSKVNTASPVSSLDNVGGPKIEDVKARRRLRGPLEELEYMDLADFKRLGRDTQESVDEIWERIELLADEAYRKKVEGLKAWRRSPLYKLYVSINLQGMREMKSIEEVIRSRQINNQESLNIEQFEAINKLNAKMTLD